MDDSLQDDLTIEDEEGILRRVPNWPNMVKIDHNRNVCRPTSACFSDRDGGRKLSATLETPLLESGGSYKTCIRKWPNFGLAKLTAGFVRHEVQPGQILQKDPQPDDLYHALVIGEKSEAVRKKMSRAATMLIKPTEIDD